MSYRRFISMAVLAIVLGQPVTLIWGGSAGKEPAASSTTDLNTIRGVVKSSSEAVLASQTEGRILQLPFKEGQRFRKGQSLVILDCEKHRAQLASAMAEHEARKKTLESNLRLLKLKAIGKLEVRVAAAELKKAYAAVQIVRVNVKGCRIQAPFSGRVVKVLVNEYENVFPNNELISILDDRHLEIDLILPSKSLVWVEQGTPFTFRIDETGQTHDAQVKEVGANVDPASQTVKIIGEFTVSPQKVLSGMSGTAHFSAQPQAGP